MNKNIFKDNRGIAPLIIVAIIAVIALAGGGVYLVTKKSPEQKKSQELNSAQNSIDQVGVSIPDLNFSQSPLPDLAVSALNVSAPNLNTGANIFTAPSVNTDFSYDVSSVNITTPSVSSYNIEMPAIPATPAQNQQAPANQPTPTPANPTGGQQGSSTDCAQFSAVPNCSYVGAAGSPGYELCKQCYPNK